jgi:predicted RNase H-like nuclease (RuvC/YqgF family)
MAEERSPEADDQPKESPSADYEAKVSELTQLIEKQNERIEGLNASLTNLGREKKAAEEAAESAAREKMTFEERVQADLAKERDARLKLEQDLLVERNTSRAKDFFRVQSIDPEYVSLVDMKTDNLDDQLQRVVDLVKKDRATALEAFAKENGQGAPKTGNGILPSGKTKRSQFTATEASAFVKEHGIDAWNALPK